MSEHSPAAGTAARSSASIFTASPGAGRGAAIIEARALHRRLTLIAEGKSRAAREYVKHIASNISRLERTTDESDRKALLTVMAENVRQFKRQFEKER